MDYEEGSSMTHVNGSDISSSVEQTVRMDGVNHLSDRIRLQSPPSNTPQEG